MKRKGASQEPLEEKAAKEQDPDKSLSEEESSSDEDTSLVDVDFEWFDPQPEFDFHGIKTLLRQLFAADSQIFDLSALTDLILSQPLLGSTVKVDGNNTDPYAFLTVLNIKEHQGTPVINDLLLYLKSRANQSTNPILVEHFDSNEASIGLILTERLINVPSEVAPPMYKMLLEEIQWAVDENEPYAFTHFLILSKKYQETASADQDEGDNTRQHKKPKKSSKRGNVETFYFHPEDEMLQKNAVTFGDFDYVKGSAESQSDSQAPLQELGIKLKGHMILLEAAKLGSAVKDMKAYFGQK